MRQDLPGLLKSAWAARQQHFPPYLLAAVPGGRRYRTLDYVNNPTTFAHVSLTGSWCALNCDHCRRQLLHSMLPINDAQELAALVTRLKPAGLTGMLLSGGFDRWGRLPLHRYWDIMSKLTSEEGLTVVVHSGQLDRDTCRQLKEVGVTQILLDLVGNRRVIRDVYHLALEPEDYRRSLEVAVDAGLEVVPHLLVGLEEEKVGTTLATLDWLAGLPVKGLVVVGLRPLPGTPLADVSPPIAAILTVLAHARIKYPSLPLALGCARAPGDGSMEQIALRAGVNAVAYPSPNTVVAARSLGLEVEFREECCSVSLGRVGCASTPPRR